MRTLRISALMPRRFWALGILVSTALSACAIRPPVDDGGGVDIGYGEVDKEHVGGSVETVGDGDEEMDRIRSLADMLRGVPGVQASVEGDEVIVRIRGGSATPATGRPLVVLDGMEYRGSLSGINPSHIKTIRVLKNAGETAVYGSRGANGVLIIVTKTGGDSVAP